MTKLFLAVVAGAFLCGGTVCFALTVHDGKEDVLLRKARAEALIKDKKYKEAVRILEAVLREISPDDPVCLETLKSFRLAADRAWDGDKFTTAVKKLLGRLEALILGSGKYRELRRSFLKMLGAYYFDHRQAFGAIETYEKLLMVCKPDEIAKMEDKLAQSYEEAGYTKKALALLERRLADDPKNISLRRRVVRLYFRLGSVDEGIEVMGKEVPPARSRYMAQQLFNARCLSKAETLAREAAEKDPSAKSLLGKINYEQKRFRDAAKIFSECFSEESKGHWRLFGLARRLAQSYSGMGVLKETIEQKERHLAGLKENEKDARIKYLILLSEMKREAADFVGALEACMGYRELLEKKDRRGRRIAELGRRALGQLLSEGKQEEAESVLRKLRGLDGGGHWLDCAQHQILVRTGREEEAEQLLSELESVTSEAKILLVADEFSNWGQGEICERLYQRILETKPDNSVYDSNAHARLGRYYCHEKKWADAKAHFAALDASLIARNVGIMREETMRGMEVYVWYRAAGDDSGVLIDLLSDPRPLRRLAAARMFGRYGSLEHIARLKDVMSSSSPELKVALEEAVTCIRARITSGQEKPGPLSEGQLEARLARSGNVLWVEKDPFDENLRWAALEKKFIAVADMKSGEVVHFTDAMEVLGKEELSPSAVAFTKDIIWVGTDHGLFAFERRVRTWSGYAVGGSSIDVAVSGLELKDGLVLVTVELDGKRQTFSFDPAKGRWQRKRG